MVGLAPGLRDTPNVRPAAPTHAISLGPSRLWLGADGVARVSVEPGTSLEVSHAEELLSALTALRQGAPIPLVSDMRGIANASREYRERLAGERARGLICATALIVGSPVSKVIAAFFLRLNAPVYPTRIHTSEAAASQWARDFL